MGGEEEKEEGRNRGEGKERTFSTWVKALVLVTGSCNAV